MKTILRIPAQSAQVVAGHFGYGVDILAQVRLDTLAYALSAMEHDDTDPGEKRMNADQCRDALLRELLGGWSASELVEAKIPGVLQMADEIATLRRERDEAKADALRYLRMIPVTMASDSAPHLSTTPTPGAQA